MKFATEYLWFCTEHQREYINITDEVQEIVRKSIEVIIQAPLLPGGFAPRTVAAATPFAMSARMGLPTTTSRTAPMARRPALRCNPQW